ncbi:hypothetical protein C6P46_006482 [Rhodotorula mucilaginosa]|uniref:Uncharacterized protein n=1 Tax=Rhodotorula mucilaginosa TaxID=5537 RepID=A0A9P6VX50_RHOMI|nr:hypothetical protein C6P46_006482 [Rhodotorula mucilaginosa]
MDQLSESTTKSLGEVELPEQLEQRLIEEQERFHHPYARVPSLLRAARAGRETLVAPHKSVDQDLQEVTARHDAIIQERVKHNHDEVEHAKQVAAAHHHQHQTGAKETGNPAAVDELSRGVQEKQRSVAQKQAELTDLDARLERAAKIERDLRARLGEAV